jgi:hypothetical protein
MSHTDDVIEIGLQIFFGLIGLLFAVAAIHYRESLCSVLLRRYREQPVQCKPKSSPYCISGVLTTVPDYELEAGCVETEQVRQLGHGTCGMSICCSRSLPPSYDAADEADKGCETVGCGKMENRDVEYDPICPAASADGRQ